MNCPKCHAAFERDTADRCDECGWSKRKEQKPERQGGIARCAWIADGEQCHYPGTGWRNTHGIGPGYCRFHVQEDCTAAYGAEIVIKSRDYRPRTLAERDRDVLFGPRTGERACQERTCPITTRALPGKDFCATHQAQFERDPASVRRVGLLAKSMKHASDYLPRQREPGDDDEEVAA